MRKIKISLFAVYVFIVLWMTLIDRQWGERRAMLVPFLEFANVLKGVRPWFYIGQILGNLAMLMTLGIMLPMIKMLVLGMSL